MVEVEFVGRAADDAPAAVALPHLAFHRRGDHATPLPQCRPGRFSVFFRRLEAELEHRATLALLGPAVGEAEDAIEHPRPPQQFLVDLHVLRVGAALAVRECRLVK